MSSSRHFIIGTGAIASAHVNGIYNFLGKDTEICAADPNAKARAAFAEKFPNIELFSSAEEMLATPSQDSDVVVIATPPFLHKDHIAMAVESGRHVVCEKPLLMNPEEIKATQALLKNHDRQLVCCSTRFVTNPATLRVKELIAEGTFGDVYNLTWNQMVQKCRTGIEYQGETTWFLDKSKSGGGCMMDWGCYDLAIFHTILQPVEVTVMQSSMVKTDVPAELPTGTVFDVETHGIITMKYVNAAGKETIVNYERSSAYYGDEKKDFSVNGTQGSVRWDWTGFGAEFELKRRGPASHEDQIETYEPPKGGCWYHASPVVEMSRLLKGETNNAISGEDALFTAAVLRAMYDAAETGEAIQLKKSDFAIS